MFWPDNEPQCSGDHCLSSCGFLSRSAIYLFFLQNTKSTLFNLSLSTKHRYIWTICFVCGCDAKASSSGHFTRSHPINILLLWLLFPADNMEHRQCECPLVWLSADNWSHATKRWTCVSKQDSVWCSTRLSAMKHAINESFHGLCTVTVSPHSNKWAPDFNRMGRKNQII